MRRRVASSQEIDRSLNTGRIASLIKFAFVMLNTSTVSVLKYATETADIPHLTLLCCCEVAVWYTNSFLKSPS